MQTVTDARKKQVNIALGIVMAGGRKPSTSALEVSKRYVAGEITATQAKQIYLKSVGLVRD